MHHYEAVINKLTIVPFRYVPNGWQEARDIHQDIFSLRFAARGNGTARSLVAALLASDPDTRDCCSFKIYRVVDGVRSATTIAEDEAARARMFRHYR